MRSALRLVCAVRHPRHHQRAQPPVPLSRGIGHRTPSSTACRPTPSINHESNSGGPLINMESEVIGHQHRRKVVVRTAQRLGFAIPVQRGPRPTVEGADGPAAASHPTLGLTARSVSNDPASGAQIANVTAGRPRRQGRYQGERRRREGGRPHRRRRRRVRRRGAPAAHRAGLADRGHARRPQVTPDGEPTPDKPST